MRRLVGLVVHNWPLKLAALALSTILYAVLVVSSSARPLPVGVPIEAVGVGPSVTILSDLGSVRSVNYFAPDDLGLRVDSSSFRATVDLSSVDPTKGPQLVVVHVTAIDPRIQVLGFDPQRIVVQLDEVVSRQVPVKVVLGPIPSGLDIGTPTTDVTEVTVTGAKSIVDRVTEAQASVTIDASGIDINRDVNIVPVDSAGTPLDASVDVAPSTVRVKLAIFTDRKAKTVPVVPVIVGSPAVGFEVDSVTVDPVVVSVEGDANDLASLDVADTAPVMVNGATSNVVRSVSLELPDGIQTINDVTITVTVTLRPVTATRTYDAGVTLVGARSDRIYTLSTDRVLAVIGGPIADLDRLSGTSVVLTLDVSGLDVGVHSVDVSANLQTGLSLLDVSPSPITVTITSPEPSVTPEPSTSPQPSPSAGA